MNTKFQDATGVTRDVKITFTEARHLREAGHDLLKINEDPEALSNLVSDPDTIITILQIILEPQTGTQGFDAFAALVPPEKFLDARAALLAGISRFFTLTGRLDCVSAIRKMTTAADQIIASVSKKRDEISVGELSGSGAENSASSPGD